MNKPTITVINASGESKTFSINDLGTKQAYKETCKHLDKGLNKKLFNEFTNQLNKQNTNHEKQTT
mgnify:CR=1 FL=1